MIVFSSAVADIADEGSLEDDPLTRVILAEERLANEFVVVDSTLSRDEYIQANRF